ncbi:hypothetical protein PIB30_052864 [Stylosanthes scabra]|uniref:SBP-type domain-containing protein n=1 Tax=Stylosanthes scabra TaxID=79078 RepID=A0ABU6VHL2_9FABA|nr:hypothetical protein [Stylosanthes scabra]
MEWNAKSLGQWDWDNLYSFNTKPTENPKLQPTDWSMEGDGEINVGLIYPSGGSACSGSELIHASSRSSKSASMNSSSNGDSKASTTMFTFERSQDDSTGKKELSKEEPVENSQAPEPSSASGEPLLTLKLGKRLYFEDVCAASDSKKPSSVSVTTSSLTHGKKCKANSQNLQHPSCQVEGCGLDLSSAKDYHRKHRVCESHSKSPRVLIAGFERRFCQQCSRFHGLSEFDDKKRSCRRRLSDHNARRRKPQPEAVQLNTSALSSSPYDPRQLMNPFGYSRTATNIGWQDIQNSRLPQTKDFLMRPAKIPSVLTMLSDGSSGLASKGMATNGNCPGKEDPISSSDTNAAQDISRALSLLSTNSWSTHATTQRFPLASSQYWHLDQQPAANPNMCVPFSDSDNSNRFQEFQMFNAPSFDSGYPCNQLD